MTYQPKNGIFEKFDRRVRAFANTRMIKYTLERPIISFSFDDFPASAIENGAQALEAHGWTGTFYACAGLAGTTNHHGLQFSAEDLMHLQAKGHEIASHTYDHVDCTQVSEEELISQIERNDSALKEMGVSEPITGFAYPYGATQIRLKRVLNEKYHAIRGIQKGVNYDCADLNEIKSTGLYSSNFQSIITQIRSLKSKPGWMSLFTHDIIDSPSPWGCTADEFQAVLEAANEVNALVLTMRDAVKLLEDQNV